MTETYAPAKTILFGEHAVVYGEPAIAVPLDSLRTSASFVDKEDQSCFSIESPLTGLDTFFNELPSAHPLKHLCLLIQDVIGFKNFPDKTLLIKSNIPPASGLGSGAACSVAIIRAFAQAYSYPLDNQSVSDIAFEIERIYHGNPSGIDNTVISYNRPVLFQKTKPLKIMTFACPPHLVVADTGIRSKTSEAVADVAQHIEQNRNAIRQIGILTEEAVPALQCGDWNKTAALMNQNQRFLREINVSSPEIEFIVQTALENGALAAKLTGAGKGGNVIALAKNEENAEQIRRGLRDKGVKVIL